MLRVLHAPVNVGNHPWVLSRHERALGLRSDLIVSYGTWLKYPADRFLSEAPPTTWASQLRQSLFGLSAALRYDVLHFYFGRSFFSWTKDRRLPGAFLDARLARLLGRKVFMTLQGCDARLSDRNSERNEITMCHLGRCGAAAVCRQTLDAERRRLIERVLPLCDRVFVLNPDLAHDVPGATFLPYANVDVEAHVPIRPRTDGPIRLLHAPSDEAIKGTRFIMEAVERLKQRWPIELILVRGLPHAEALKLYGQADLVIDQLLAGWYGGFAVEAMALGKPVACYLRDADLMSLPAAMRGDLPLLRVAYPTLERDLELLLQQRSRWPEWGEVARAYVLRWHHPRRLAAAMVRAYCEPGSPFELDCARPTEWLRAA
jgi:hypothetical protein